VWRAAYVNDSWLKRFIEEGDVVTNQFELLLDDVDLVIRSKMADLKSSLSCLMARGDTLSLQRDLSNSDGILQHLAEIQNGSLMIERLCEELMTLMTHRKRIKVHETAANYLLKERDPKPEDKYALFGEY
jgi:hypothetical protein